MMSVKLYLAVLSATKREELIKKFYEEHFDKLLERAEQGYLDYDVKFGDLDKELQDALVKEEENLSEIITDVDVTLVRVRNILLPSSEFVYYVNFSWDHE